MNNIDSTRFNELYCGLTENEKTTFKTFTIRMLKVNFMLQKTNNDLYIFALTHKELLSLFFEYISFDFNIRDDKGLIYIKTSDETVISRINKNETLCLLILRLVYQEKMEEVSLSDEVQITVKDLQDKLFAVGFESQSNDRVKKSTLSDMLKIFKQHNIVYYSEDLSLDNTRIEIYPSIEVTMDFKQLEEISNRLEMLKGGDASDD
ncbi:MAG: DUF4194 domain-containing protein [Erysipelotrichales bacterium]|nr:DUF4194 domain-containing protein [Erysipelotrichales bacterium]